MTAPRQLPCGRRVDGIITQVGEGRAADRDVHQSGCVHCQAALAEYDRLWAPVRELVAEPVPVPAGLLDAILARVQHTTEHAGYRILESRAEPPGSPLASSR